MDGSNSAFLADTPYLSSVVPHDDAGILYIEDFDAPPEADEPPDPAPASFTEADLAAAREAGRREGHEAALADALATQAELDAASHAALADAVAAARDTLERVALRAAEDSARTMLAMLRAAIPATMAQNGAVEIDQILHTLLPGLRCAPEARVRAHPALAEHVREWLSAALPPELTQLCVVADAALAPGDVLVSWRDGQARRDCAALWASITDALAPLSLPPIEEICRGRN